MQNFTELEQQLNQLEELQQIRLSVSVFIRLLKVLQEEKEKKIPYVPVPLHLLFAGEEGTGRTRAAELIGQIYHAVGCLSEGNLIQASARELGQESVFELVSRAEGNVLLLSEISTLTPNGADFLETILSDGSGNLAVILKGTPQELECLLEAMPQLRQRFCECFAFADFQKEPVQKSGRKFEIFDVSSLAEQEEQLEALQEAEFPVPKLPLPVKFSRKNRDGTALQAGQRLDLTPYSEEEIRIRLVWERLKLPMEMDAYVYLLHENEMTSCDEDMIFFGNVISQSGGAAVVEHAEYPETAFVLNRIFQDVQKIAVCFSAYGDNPAFDFSQVVKPVLQIFHGTEQIAYMELQNLSTERTLVAAELYRWKNSWKFRAVAAGYRDGLEELCARFGIETE